MDKEGMLSTVRTNWWQVGLMVIGLTMLILGAVTLKSQSRGDQVEIIRAVASPSATNAQQLVIDVAGAVEKPGLYRLPVGARIGEAIIAAGGLSAKADRSFVAQSLNQAEVVKDGMKLFIPEQGKLEQSSNSQLPISKQSGIVSVNTSTEAELDSLWGIGASRAKTVIENRPYSSMSELMEKAKITQEILDKNQGKIGL